MCVHNPMFVLKYERNTRSSVSNNFTRLTLLGYDVLLLYSNQCVQIFARKIYIEARKCSSLLRRPVVK